MSDESAPVDELEEATTSDETTDEVGEAEEESGDDTPAEEPEHKGFQKRINALTWQKHEAERRAEALERALAEAKREPVKPVDVVAPNPLDFDDPGKFQVAQGEYTRAVARQIAEEARQQEASSRAQTERQTQEQRYREAISAHAADDPEFVDLIRSANVQLSDAMTEVLVSSARPVELTRYLAEHAGEAVRIAGLSPVQQAREMGRIEARIEALTQNKVSGAPAQMRRPKGNERVRVDPDKMSVSEWQRWREAQLAKRK